MTTLFLDTFTGADGTALTAHAPDTAPAGVYTLSGGSMAIQSNRATGTSGSADHSANYTFSAPFVPTLPYTVSMTGRSYGLGDYNTGLILGGATESLKVLLVDPTHVSVIVNNSESFDAVVTAGEHTLSVYVEATQFTVTLDGVAQSPVSIADPTSHFDTLTVTLEYPGSGASYVDVVSVIDSASPAPSPPPPTFGPGLPAITPPHGTPPFISEGHGIEEDSYYAQVQSITGHSRSRRRWTKTDRVVTVKWLLDPTSLVAVDDWYENTLLAGTREFSARVRKQGAGPERMLWWRARWIDYQTEMMVLGYGMGSGRLLLMGEGSIYPPETGAMAMEVGIALLDIRSDVAVQAHLAMEVLIDLRRPTQLAMEASIALLMERFITGARITENASQRTTSSGDERVIETGEISGLDTVRSADEDSWRVSEDRYYRIPE